MRLAGYACCSLTSRWDQLANVSFYVGAILQRQPGGRERLEPEEIRDTGWRRI